VSGQALASGEIAGRNFNYVWDPLGLVPVVMTQPGSIAGGGGAVTVADGADVAQGTTTDAEAAGNGTVIGILKRLRTLLTNPLAVTGTFWQATQAVSAVSLPLPTGAAAEAGNLATIAAKDFATSAKQDTALASLTTLDTDLKAEIGVIGTTPGAFTVLDRLNQIGSKIDAATKNAATEATMRKLLAALSKPAAPSYSTLLHR
jgi:hypothetical protein